MSRYAVKLASKFEFTVELYTAKKRTNMTFFLERTVSAMEPQNCFSMLFRSVCVEKICTKFLSHSFGLSKSNFLNWS
jgi:hypothetical protein